MLKLVNDQVVHFSRDLWHHLFVKMWSQMKGVSFDITNGDNKHKILYIEPLGLKFGMDPKDCLILIIHGEEPFVMFLGDSDEGIHIEFQGEVDFKVMDGDEELRSGHNLIF